MSSLTIQHFIDAQAKVDAIMDKKMTPLGNLFGMKVIVSEYAYSTKIRVRGIADVRKPNTRKPYYRKVVIRTPRMYIVGGSQLVIHPSLWDEVKRSLEKDAMSSLLYGSLGI